MGMEVHWYLILLAEGQRQQKRYRYTQDLERNRSVGLTEAPRRHYNTIIYDMTMDYRPYSPEWHRRRYLKEALDKYFDDYVDTDVIRQDILSILSERSDKAYEEFMRINQLEKALQ